jgi:glycosyltransferase involved in cell wall biosynthesis
MISIIIRTYNEEKYLNELLKQIFNQNNKNFEVIIVDSGSNDNTLKIIKDYNIKLIKINKNDFSFGYSLNKGIENSNGDLCVFISGHCIPVNNEWLNDLIKPFEDEKVMLSYGRQIGVDSSKFSEIQIFKRWYPNNSNLNQDNPFCNNANACIRKKFWLKYYKYNETLTGLEDIDYGLKILENNYKIVYVSNSIVKHIHNETFSQIKWRYERESITYYKINKNEHFYLNDFIKYFILNVFNDINQKNGYKNIISIILFRYNQFMGTFKGYKYIKNKRSLKNKFYWK